MLSHPCKKSPYYYQAIGEKLSEIGARLDYPRLTKDLAEGIETLWNDPAIQVCLCLHVFLHLLCKPSL